MAVSTDPLTPGEDLDVGDYLRQWLAHVAGRVRPKTLDGYRGLIRLYASPGLGSLLLIELGPLQVQGLYSEMLERGLSAGTVVNMHLVLTQALGHLFAVAEAYPQLRASESFTALHRDLGDAEDKIAFARQFYNRNVLDFNTRVEAFPGNLVAGTLGFAPAEFFEATDEGRAEVKVDLSTAPRAQPSDTPPTSPP